MVVPASHYREAVEMFRRPLGYGLPPATHGDEDEPHPGVIPSKNAPSFQRASRNDAIRATLQTKQPYGDELHKFLALGSLFHWEMPAEQTTMEAAFPEAQSPEHASLFKTANNVAVPKLVVRVVHDSGAGEDVDGSGRVQADDKVLITCGGGVIGGAQGGARRMVVVGSEEDQRLNTPEAAATTVTDHTMIIPLYDAFVLAARSDTLYQTGPWLSKNVVGLAKVGGRHGLSLVKTKEGSTRGGEPWVYLVIVIDNWEYCWSGPFFVATVTRWGCFSGYKNLCKHDKTARGMEVGRSGYFSTPATKATATLREETVKHAAHQRTIDSGRTPLRGNVNYTAKECCCCWTATVRGEMVTVSEAAWEGRAASTPLEIEAMDQISADSSRGGKLLLLLLLLLFLVESARCSSWLSPHLVTSTFPVVFISNIVAFKHSRYLLVSRVFDASVFSELVPHRRYYCEQVVVCSCCRRRYCCCCYCYCCCCCRQSVLFDFWNEHITVDRTERDALRASNWCMVGLSLFPPPVAFVAGVSVSVVVVVAVVETNILECTRGCFSLFRFSWL
ncbi:unnamed protein product [Scytosiphon promiscuus]